MTIYLGRGLTALIAACALGLTACGSDVQDEPAPAENVAVEDEPTAVDESSDGEDSDEAVLSDRDVAVAAVEGALRSKDAKAVWDGDILRVTLDGDVESPTAYIQCSLEELMEEDQKIVFVYPNGEIDCDDDPREA